MLRILDRENSVLNQFVAEMRDEKIQRDPMRFRFNLERIGRIVAYEISKTLAYSSRDVITPLGEASIMLPADKVVLASILRSGIPMHNGMLDIFDKAENAFVTAFRKYSKDGSMNIVVEQVTTPLLEDKVLIIVDPMLATGTSIEMAYHALVDQGGNPQHTHFVAVVSSSDGIEYVQRNLPMERVTIWTAAVDSEMTVKSYIVPGIGDTGDLAFGEKL